MWSQVGNEAMCKMLLSNLLDTDTKGTEPIVRFTELSVL